MELNGKIKRQDLYIAAIISLLFLSWGLLVLDDYGVTWDEPEHLKLGLRYLDFFSTGKISIGDIGGYLQLYGPFSAILGAISHRIFYSSLHLLGYWESFHLMNLLFAASAVFILYVFSSQAYGRGVAILSVLSILTFPQFIGHAFNNSKDLPVMALFLAAIWAFWNLIATKKTRWAILGGVFFGLAFDTKINGLFVVPVILLWLVISYRDKVQAIVKGNGKPEINVRLKMGIIIFLCAIVTIYLFWPYLWDDPVNKVYGSVLFFSSMGTLIFPPDVLYLGEIYPASMIPWHYSIISLAVVTPLAILYFSIVGIFISVEQLWNNKNRTAGLLLAWLLVSLLKQAIPGIEVYHGIRHFLEVTPVLCILAGVGAYAVYSDLKTIIGKNVKKQAAAIIACIIILTPYAYSVYEITRAHPYETSYFSSIVGGPSGAANKFVVQYWEHVNKAGSLWLNENAPKNSKVLIVSGDFLAVYYLRPDIKIININDILVNDKADLSKIDYIMSNTYLGNQNKTIEHTETVMDYPILYIYKIQNTATGAT